MAFLRGNEIMSLLNILTMTEMIREHKCQMVICSNRLMMFKVDSEEMNQILDISVHLVKCSACTVGKG